MRWQWSAVNRVLKAKIHCPAGGRFEPAVAGLYNLLDEDTGGHNGDELFDYQLENCETAYRIGVLAGVILAGHDAATIDKFTRGLSWPGLVKT